jgi:uncharacterized protein
MKYQEFTTFFKEQVYNLNENRQLKLAIDISKKLFPDYQNFVNENSWGNPDALIDAISACEQSANIPPSQEELQKLQLELDKVTPDTDEFGDVMSSYAFNASNAVYYTLQFLIDKHPSSIVNIGTALTDTIDFKIQEDGAEAEEEIDNHPLMKEAREYLLEQSKPN